MRIATLNVWGWNGPWRDRLGLIRAELERLQPDLVGLQEINRNDDGCQAEEIAEGLGYQVAFGVACEPEGRQYGNALLSRLPILQQRTFALPIGDPETRALLHARVATPDGELPVFVTHLDWQPHHGAARLAQVRFIVDTIANLPAASPPPAPHADSPPPALGGGPQPALGNDGLPPVLMGDFNAEPDSDEIRYLRGLAVVDGTSTYFADAWTYGGNGSPGTTFDRRNDYARAAREPSRRIDYIFTGIDHRRRGEPMHAELAFAVPKPLDGVTVWPSDHFGLVTDLSHTVR